MIVGKTILMIVGFPGYIPVVDEVYNFFMTPVFNAGGLAVVPVTSKF